MNMCLGLLKSSDVDFHQVLECFSILSLNLRQSKMLDLMARWTQGHDPL